MLLPDVLLESSSETSEKPKLTIEEQIEHLEKKGIKFQKYTKEEAKNYLEENNNYFKIRAYRTSFEKYQNGPNANKYIDLDFAALRDLAIIDMELRYIILPLALDIEHFEKVKLLKYIAASDEDGYAIVHSYLEHLQKQDEIDANSHSYDLLMSEIKRNQRNSYCSGIVQKYQEHFPIWAFLEVITFGSLIYFLDYCLTYFNDQTFTNLFNEDYYLLRSIKKLRNAAAHNNCILNQLARDTATKKTNYNVTRMLGEIGFSKDQRNRFMSSMALQNIVTLLYTHNKIITSQGVKNHRAILLKQLGERFFKHSDYYTNNPSIISSFEFLKKTIDKIFEV